MTGHTRRRSTGRIRPSVARLPEGNRDARQMMEAVHRHPCQVAGPYVRVSRSLALDPRSRAARPRCKHRSPVEPRESQPLHRRQVRSGVATGARPVASEAEPQVARPLPTSKLRQWRRSYPVPYRLDTPPPLTVTRQRRRLVGKSTCQRLRFAAENARPCRFRSGLLPATSPPRSRSSPTLPSRRPEYPRSAAEATFGLTS
jgi:hypothetical protein